ncbi:MAG: carboxypeptidase-like regulatory domain-containing protein, partial [Bacteroidales bacterium]
MRECRMKVRFTFLTLFVLMCNLTVVAQGGRKITGVVLDELKYPMVGVAVTTPSKGIGTVTDLDGQYQLQVPAGVNELVFSYLGYESQTVTIGKQSNINVSLKPSSQALDEVVVVGYGTSAVKDITGSVATIGAKELGNLNVTSAASLLQNLATGVQVTQNT